MHEGHEGKLECGVGSRSPYGGGALQLDAGRFFDGQAGGGDAIVSDRQHVCNSGSDDVSSNRVRERLVDEDSEKMGGRSLNLQRVELRDCSYCSVCRQTHPRVNASKARCFNACRRSQPLSEICHVVISYGQA